MCHDVKLMYQTKPMFLFWIALFHVPKTFFSVIIVLGYVKDNVLFFSHINDIPVFGSVYKTL